ncbi:unnamed protein product, partial [Effrenium voratum]
AQDAGFLKKHGITHLVSVAEECPPSAPVQTLHLALRDSPLTDVRSRFSEVFDFVDQARASAKPGAALIHCFEGKNRSAAFVIAYVMREEKLNLQDAFARVKGVRSLVDPNIGFLKQLRDFELELGCEALSLPFDAEACRDLLDLELISVAELARYTDLKELTYEGNNVRIREGPKESAEAARSAGLNHQGERAS